jgi:cell wall-associated NlpC family hydrolase
MTPPATIALVRSPIAPMLAEPRVSATQHSQALFGRSLLVVARDGAGDWLRVRTLHDGYEGWTHAGYLEVLDVPSLPDDPEVFGAWDARRWDEVAPSAPADPEALRAAFGGETSRTSLGCTVRAGARTLALPVGAVVHPAQAIVAGDAVALDAQPARFPWDGEAIVATARALFEGTSYQWGGVTPWGADCSGLVQAVFQLHGADLPRDAWQQARLGAAVAASMPADADDARPVVDVDVLLAAVRPADLLFFSDRADARPTHVGLAVGGGRMAHLALGRGGWAVDDLADVGDPYVARLRRDCLGARRLG